MDHKRRVSTSLPLRRRPSRLSATESTTRARSIMNAVIAIGEGDPQPVETAEADDLHPRFWLRLLDEIDYGLVVVSAQGRVQHANHLARQVMTAGRVLEGSVGQALV